MVYQFVIDIHLRADAQNPFREIWNATDGLAPRTIVRVHIGHHTPELITSCAWHNPELDWQFCADDSRLLITWQRAIALIGGGNAWNSNK